MTQVFGTFSSFFLSAEAKNIKYVSFFCFLCHDFDIFHIYIIFTILPSRYNGEEKAE